MPKCCADCKSYPWLRSFRPNDLPAAKCGAGERAWTEESRDVENECECYEGEAAGEVRVKKADLLKEAIELGIFKDEAEGKTLKASEIAELIEKAKSGGDAA